MLCDQGRENRDGSVDRLSEIQSDCLSIFETVKVNLKDVVGYHSYEGRIPVLMERSAKVFLLRVEGGPPGLATVIRHLDRAKKPHSSIEGELAYLATERVIRGCPSRRKELEIYPCFSVRNFISKYLAQRQEEAREAEGRKRK